MKKVKPYSYDVDSFQRKDIDIYQLRRKGKTILSCADNLFFYHNDVTDFIVQSYSQPSFLIELFEINTEEPFCLDLQMHEQKFFLFIMLRGSAKFMSNDGQTVEVRPKHLKLSFFTPGSYQVGTEKGQHLAMVISLPKKWTNRIGDSMHPINEFLRNHQNADTLYCFFPQVRLKEHGSMFVDKILAYHSSHPGIMDTHIRNMTALLLEYYSIGTKIKYKEPVYQILEFLNENYLLENLSITYLEDRFNYSQRVITYHFKKEFGITPQQYYIRLRMLYAKKLSEIQGVPPVSLYTEAGYKNPDSFRKAYKKFLSTLTP